MGEHKARTKIAVYAIAKNEAAQVDRFVAGCGGADGIFVLDTGSTDGTPETLRALGVVTGELKGDFAFDVARNQALALVPDEFEIRVALDLDEVPDPGWADKVRSAWRREGVNHLTYLEWCGGSFVPKRNIHGKGFEWRYPIHEGLYPCDGQQSKMARADIIVRHLPDDNKPRDWYLPMLERATKSMPNDARMAFYYARELHYRKQHDRAAIEFGRYFSLPDGSWASQRAEALRFLAASLVELKQESAAEVCLLRGCCEYPTSREPWLELARFYLKRNLFHGAYYAAKQALAIAHRNLDVAEYESSWKEAPHDTLATAAWYMGLKDEARKHVNLAFHHAPTDERIRKNHAMMEGIQL